MANLDCSTVSFFTLSCSIFDSFCISLCFFSNNLSVVVWCVFCRLSRLNWGIICGDKDWPVLLVKADSAAVLTFSSSEFDREEVSTLELEEELSFLELVGELEFLSLILANKDANGEEASFLWIIFSSRDDDELSPLSTSPGEISENDESLSTYGMDSGWSPTSW